MLTIVPEDIAMDPWILFHGTSNVYSAAIDAEGLRPQRSAFAPNEIRGVVRLFEQLHWAGTHGGGMAVLKPFSLDHDFSRAEGKPLYLGESAHRAGLYATRDFAGGEICRALHYCLQDLRAYCDTIEVRERHHHALSLHPEPVRIAPSDLPNLESLEQALLQLERLVAKVAALRSDFTHGLLFAVRLDTSRLDAVKYHRSMGIKCFRPIEPREIAGCFEVPANFEYDSYQSDPRRKLNLTDGIVPLLRS